LQTFREIIESKKAKKDYLLDLKKKKERKLKKLNLSNDDLKEVREIIQTAALISQNAIAKHISSIITKALHTVFPNDNLSFSIEFSEGRGKTEAHINVLEDGEEFDIFYDRGFGVADIISFTLRVSYVILGPTANIVIVDEPFRNLDIEKHEITSLMIKELSKNLGVQFIICTHSDLLKRYADKAFHVTRVKKVSRVKEVLTN
jgi:predicted ATPase